jgi:hypothetical protein
MMKPRQNRVRLASLAIKRTNMPSPVPAENGTATFIAASSSVSRAIFCASMTSPEARKPCGTKHKPRTGCPVSSSSKTFC